MTGFIATAVVLSRLDYANSLVYDRSAPNMAKLQCVQKIATRGPKVLGTKRPRPTQQLLCSLRWLLVHSRINYKISALTIRLWHIIIRYISVIS